MTTRIAVRIVIAILCANGVQDRAVSEDSVGSAAVLYGPQVDVLREGRRSVAVDMLADTNEIYWWSPFLPSYSDFKIPVYRNHPFEPGADESIPNLIAQLRHDEVPRNATIAWEKLVRIGRPAVPYLIDAIENGTHQQWWAASSILGRIGGDDAIEALIRQLPNDHRDHNGLAAYLALLEIGEPALPALRKVAESSDRQQATYAKCLLSVLAINPEAGAPWTSEEDNAVIKSIEHGEWLERVATRLHRSEYEIGYRYTKLKNQRQK